MAPQPQQTRPTQGAIVKRKTTKAVVSIACCSLLWSGAFLPACAQAVRGGAAAPSAAAVSVLRVPATASPLFLAAPLAATASPLSVLPSFPAAANAPESNDRRPVPAAQAPVDPLAQAQAAAAPATGEHAAKSEAGERAAAEGSAIFDQSAAQPELPTASDGTRLDRLYPKVVFIQDVFSGPAPEAVADYVNRLIAAGVHVVFMTWRPQKGPGSADEVLLSRVKQSRNNPVVVVAFNGGKIALHGRAANPKAIVDNVGQFPADHVVKIREMAEKIAENSGGKASVIAVPEEKEAFSISINISGPTRAAAMRALNGKIKTAGFPYKAEAHPEDPNTLIIHAMPLRFSLERVYDALENTFPGEILSPGSRSELLQPEKFLAVVDSMKSPRFSTSFPKLAEVQVAGDGAGVGAVLGATLGLGRLETVVIKLGKLRQYVEYWESMRRFVVGDADGGTGGGGGGGGGSGVRGGGDRKTGQMLAMFVGTVINRLMATLYENIRNGQHQFAATEWAVQEQLKAMWAKPLENNVYVNKKLAAVLAVVPYEVKKGYLDKASAYVSNYYSRRLAAYRLVSGDIMRNLVSLNTDRKSSIMLEFKSDATGKVYKIHTRIPRVMRQFSSEGVTLTAYAYRTGKESADEGEEFLSRLYAMALLKGHARKGTDGKWHQGSPEGPIITKLVVQFERHSSERIKTYFASQFDSMEEGGMIEGPVVREITSAIERMEADPEFQEYYREQEQEATKEDLKKPAGVKRASRALPSRVGQASKTAKARKLAAVSPKGASKKNALRKGRK
jgi:hypothetical protein